MATSRDAALAILRQNVGFDDPERWVDYAARHGFRPTAATPVPNCPDCGRAPAERLGQYVYYSTLIHLMRCGSCHLIWSDVHLDARIVSEHFERAYKDRDYFRRARAWIFGHLAATIGDLTPRGGSVLDIGGAQGDLMHQVTIRRPDATAVVQDLSEQSVRYAAEHFDLPTVRGDVGALETHDARYDVVVLSDVLYLEPRIAAFWAALPGLVKPGGSVIMRVPNRLPLIRAYLALSRLARSLVPGRLQDQIRFFNPEHIYILSRRYLTTRLSQLGFASVRVQPSPPLAPCPAPERALARLLFPVSEALSVLSGRALALSSSMLVVATGRPPRLAPGR